VKIPCNDPRAPSSVIRSLFADDKSKVLVGTKNNEIYEIDDTPRLIVQGHCQGELWGMAVHPQGLKVATGSDDGSVRVWSVEERRQLVMRVLVAKPVEIPSTSSNTGSIRSIAFSPKGDMIAAGLITGTVYILREDTLDELHVLEDRREWVSDLKWSPNGDYLAVGTHDSFVDIYASDRGYKRVGTCMGHSSFITHIDWSLDGTRLVSNSGDYEDVEWASRTRVLSWHSLGVWHRGSDGSDVNAVDCKPGESKCLATGDDRGIVSLFRYPALGGRPRLYGGHSSHITNVRFSPSGSKLFSAGGADACFCLWNVV
ncbi:hypothetical protein CYMTET_34449, partial [Cymbomonas tetramitiformis]